jgi:hypothetical protein
MLSMIFALVGINNFAQFKYYNAQKSMKEISKGTKYFSQ